MPHIGVPLATQQVVCCRWTFRSEQVSEFLLTEFSEVRKDREKAYGSNPTHVTSSSTPLESAHPYIGDSIRYGQPVSASSMKVLS